MRNSSILASPSTIGVDWWVCLDHQSCRCLLGNSTTSSSQLCLAILKMYQTNTSAIQSVGTDSWSSCLLDFAFKPHYVENLQFVAMYLYVVACVICSFLLEDWALIFLLLTILFRFIRAPLTSPATWLCVASQASYWLPYHFRDIELQRFSHSLLLTHLIVVTRLCFLYCFTRACLPSELIPLNQVSYCARWRRSSVGWSQRFLE